MVNWWRFLVGHLQGHCGVCTYLGWPTTPTPLAALHRPQGPPRGIGLLSSTCCHSRLQRTRVVCPHCSSSPRRGTKQTVRQHVKPVHAIQPDVRAGKCPPAGVGPKSPRPQTGAAGADNSSVALSLVHVWGTGPTPAWGHGGQGTPCQSKLAVKLRRNNKGQHRREHGHVTGQHPFGTDWPNRSTPAHGHVTGHHPFETDWPNRSTPA